MTPNAASKTYGAADPALDRHAERLPRGDGVTATYSRTAGETVAGEPYTISAVLSPAGVLGNYTITYNTAAFTITTKAGVGDADAASKTYGDADPAFTGTLSGFLGGGRRDRDVQPRRRRDGRGQAVHDQRRAEPGGVLGNYSDHLQHGGLHDRRRQSASVTPTRRARPTARPTRR